MVEDLPTYFWMNNYFGLWIPSYFVINQNIEIIGGGSGSLTSEGFFAEITSSIEEALDGLGDIDIGCLLYTSPSPRDVEESRMPSSA